ncbi:hypothetical protein B0H14DRAFT_2969701, partial [Mycena olivaceomarginata]
TLVHLTSPAHWVIGLSIVRSPEYDFFLLFSFYSIIDFMLRLLDTLLPIFSRLNSLVSPHRLVLVPVPVPPSQDESWYVNVWGIISRDRTVSLRARHQRSIRFTGRPPLTMPSSTSPAAAASKQPLDLEQKTLSSFLSSTGTRRSIMTGLYLIFHFHHLTSPSYAAENAWRRQGVQTNGIFVTLSWNDAWARAQGWPSTNTEYL